MANLTEHVIINKLNKDINSAILAVGGDTTNTRGLLDYPQVIENQLISRKAAGVISFKGVFDSLEEVDNPTKGDFVIVGEIEYVYFDKWIELGNTTAAMSAIQDLRSQCVLTSEDGAYIRTDNLSYSFGSNVMRIGAGMDDADALFYDGQWLSLGTEAEFSYQNPGETTHLKIGRTRIDFGKIGTNVGSIGNDRYYEYVPLTIGANGLTIRSLHPDQISTTSYYFNNSGDINSRNINADTIKSSQYIVNDREFFNSNGLTSGITLKYRDINNRLQTQTYKASPYATYAFDISSGIYYAKTAAKVENPLTIHTQNEDIVYDGTSSKEITIGQSLSLIPITYQELKSLRDNAELVPGTKYKITDYETIISGQNVANNKFDIIVTALSNNTLSESASVAINENDLIFEASRNIFSWSDVNNWDNVNTSDIPQEIVNLSPSAVAKQQGTRTVNGGEVVRVSIVGYTGDYQNPAVQEDVKGLGASLYTKNDNTLIASDYGYDKDVYYLHVPESIAANTEMIIQFYIDSDADVASAGICGAIADAGQLLPHPSRSYFSNSNLSAWEIKYSLDNDGGRYLWANPNGKGVIYYMKDEYGNEASYDFKNIKYGDHYTFDYLIDNVHYDGSVKYGRYCHHNKIDLDINGYGDKGLPNACFKNTTNNAECSHNIIGEDCWNITFGSGCHHNEISNGCESLTFGNNCSYNVLENHCSRNNFGSQCSYNTFGHDSCDNTFGDYVTQCSFGCRCSSCQFTYPDGARASYIKSFHLPEDCNSLVIQQTQDNSNANSYLQYYKLLNPISNKTIELNPVVYKNETLSHNNRSYYTFLTGEDQIINNTVVEQIIG